jgi:hypothetical protein
MPRRGKQFGLHAQPKGQRERLGCPTFTCLKVRLRLVKQVWVGRA